MKVIRNLKAFFKNVAGSRTAQVFFSIHLIFLLIALSKRGFLLEPLHPDNETLLLSILAVLSIPSIPLTIILGIPLALIRLLLESSDVLSNSAKVFFTQFYIYPNVFFLAGAMGVNRLWN